VTVSYFEWVQNRAGVSWTEEEVQRRLQEVILREFEAVDRLKDAKSLDMRTAAYVLALNRIGESLDALGSRQYYQQD
jgi:glutamate dehydrogenase (NADP+)